MIIAIRRLCSVLIAAVAFLAVPFALARSSDTLATAIKFKNEDVTLSGDFYLPERPIGALVLVHGSGPATRMRRIAQFFAERGFAVVTWDKRGVGQSGGNYEADRNTSPENLKLLAGDAAAAMNWLTAQPSVVGLPIGYWGISQAGWIIPLAALRTPRVDFITLWSGPVCTVTEEMEAGIGIGGNLSTDEHARTFIAGLRAQNADTDPRDALRNLHIPGLWLFGGRDDTKVIGLSIERLSGLIQAGQSHFEYRLTPEAGHFMNVETDRVVIDAMVEWMRKREAIK